MPNNFGMVQTGMVCNTFAKQYPEDDQDKKSWTKKKGLSYDNPRSYYSLTQINILN